MGYCVQILHVILDLGCVQETGGTAAGKTQNLPHLDRTHLPAALDLPVHDGGWLNHLTVKGIKACSPIRLPTIDPVLIPDTNCGIRRPWIVPAVDQVLVLIGHAIRVAACCSHGETTRIKLAGIHHNSDILIIDLYCGYLCPDLWNQGNRKR